MAFPVERPRRLRATAEIRSLVRETDLNPGDCILPLFIVPGEEVKREISSMPGNYQMSIDIAVRECEQLVGLGVGGTPILDLAYDEDSNAEADMNVVMDGNSQLIEVQATAAL